MNAALHTLVVCGKHDATVNRDELLELVWQIAEAAGWTASSSWQGRLLNEQLEHKCTFIGCKIKHGSGLFSEDGAKLSAIRFACRKDFRQGKAKEKKPAQSALEMLQKQIANMCDQPLTGDHTNCKHRHIVTTLADEPYEPKAKETNVFLKEAVSMALAAMTEKSGSAEDTVKSEELLDEMEKILDCQHLVEPLKLDQRGAKITRHAIGRLIGSSAHWGHARDSQSRSFLGWKTRSGICGRWQWLFLQLLIKENASREVLLDVCSIGR